MKLTERTKALLMMGAKITGSMLEGFHYAWENFYTDEVEGVQEFCKWIDENVGGCSEYNIDRLAECFNNPDNPENQMFVTALADRIKQFK